jgi:ribosomal protein S18 acetylase RimI-like enzyme
MPEQIDSEDIVYGKPRAQDAAALGELFYADMLALGVDTTSDDMERFAGRVIEASFDPPNGCICRVARQRPDGPPCGVVLANVHWSLKFAGRALWIEELYVDPDVRRRGIGRRLVELILDYAEEHDFRGVDLEAYQGNTPASVLYRTMGFHRLGRERFYYRLGDREFL